MIIGKVKSNNMIFIPKHSNDIFEYDDDLDSKLVTISKILKPNKSISVRFGKLYKAKHIRCSTMRDLYTIDALEWLYINMNNEYDTYNAIHNNYIFNHLIQMANMNLELLEFVENKTTGLDDINLWLRLSRNVAGIQWCLNHGIKMTDDMINWLRFCNKENDNVLNFLETLNESN